ncbi:MAG: tRNA (adenosine(37)-N6)-threonylcarbamoyltransferase complex ATPase subunit type 1 TsaE [Steroidobacteraceae bacterium]
MRWQAQTAEDTEAFGAQLAGARPPGDAWSVVYLCGDLGAGKTTLARGFLRACGVVGPVRSPTYTLLEVYETPAISLLHLDLYRLHDPAELETLGLREWARPGYVWLVEWPERGAGRLPPPDLSVRLTAGSKGHGISVTAGSPAGEAWVRSFAIAGPPVPAGHGSVEKRPRRS